MRGHRPGGARGPVGWCVVTPDPRTPSDAPPTPDALGASTPQTSPSERPSQAERPGRVEQAAQLAQAEQTEQPASSQEGGGAWPHPYGADRRRGPFRPGERVQVTDVKGRRHTTLLTTDGYFQSQRGSFRHTELIGKPEGTVLETESGHDLLALRPLLHDYVMSMPRGAAVVYPKDAAMIVQYADIQPGCRVVEAGAGSGALSMSLLTAIGPSGHLLSVERRAEFAEIADGNVTSWFGEHPDFWELRVGSLADVLDEGEAHGVDRVVLDMLAPWENVEAVARALAPGGLVLAYVATTTQLSRYIETLRGSECFTEPDAFETLVRGWHVEGLAVRPDHRMVAHTGFLVTARRLAPGGRPPSRTRRPAKGAYTGVDVSLLAARAEVPTEEEWASEDIGQRVSTDKKVRRAVRDVQRRHEVEARGTAAPPCPSRGNTVGAAAEKPADANRTPRATEPADPTDQTGPTVLAEDAAPEREENR